MANDLLKGKKIAMIIAFSDFRDEELFIPRSIFSGQGAEVKIASVKTGQALGTYGGVANVDILLHDFNPSQFDAVIFAGGAGAHGYIEDENCWRIVKETLSQGKVLGAICIAPAILARAGVLKGKKATVWSSNMDKSVVKILKQEGVYYETAPVVVDENIITADGPSAARKFGEAVVRVLTGR